MPHVRIACTAPCAALIAVLMLLPAAPARSQQAPAGDSIANGGDPGIVITRTVQPRIAYRGVPLQDNPIRAEATTFPARVFHGTLERVLGQVVGDAALGQRGSLGIGGPAAGQAMPVGAQVTSATSGTGAWFATTAARGANSVPTGPTAAIAGAVGGATAGLGGTITDAVMRAVGPAARPAGGGGP